MATSHVELNDQLQDGTWVTLGNQTRDDMLLLRSHSWSGSFAPAGAPPIIKSDSCVSFTHFKGNEGSIAAVIYAIRTPVDQPSAVVVAWNAPTNFNPPNFPNKVGIYCGPTSFIIDDLNWDQIRMALDGRAMLPIDMGMLFEANIRNSPARRMAELTVICEHCPKPGSNLILL